MEFPASTPLMITAMADYSDNEQTNLINLLVNLRGKGRLDEVKRYLPFAFLAPEKFRLVARWGDEDFAFYKALWSWKQPADEKVAKREFLALRKEHDGKILAWPFWVEIKPMEVARPFVAPPPPAERKVRLKEQREHPAPAFPRGSPAREQQRLLAAASGPRRAPRALQRAHCRQPGRACAAAAP